MSLSSFGSNEQLTLFEETNRKERAALLKAMDAVNDKYGEYKIIWASTAAEEKGHGVISPAWRTFRHQEKRCVSVIWNLTTSRIQQYPVPLAGACFFVS